MNDVLYYVGLLISIYGYVLFARMIMSWVLALSQYRPSGVAAVAFEFVYTITDPPLRLLRRWIPPLNMGRVSFDVSFIVLALACSIVGNELMRG